MNRDALAHVIRAVCTHTGLPEVVVLGSQAILGTADAADLPDAATRSIEADIAVDPVRLVAHDPALIGVEAERVATAVLPDGWRDRLRPLVVDRPAAETVVGWCLEVHDL